jgi:hypothetical protein
MKMDYGIKKVIKEKKFSKGKIMIAQLNGHNLYGVLVFDSDGNLTDSCCNCCFDESNLREVFKMNRRIFKRKISQHFSH